MSFFQETHSRKTSLFEQLTTTSCLLICIVLAMACGQSTGLNPGDNAPRPKLETLNGERTTLDKQITGPTIISFWASWCEPCIRELPALERLHQALKNHGGQVVGIAIDDTAPRIRAQMDSHGVTFPVFLDSWGQGKQKFKVKGVPETFFLNRDGKISMIITPEGEPEIKLMGSHDWMAKDTIEMVSRGLGVTLKN